LVQGHVDKLDVKLQSISKGYTTDSTGAVDELKTLFTNKSNDIKNFSGDNLNLKVAGTMTVSSSLTGDGMRTYTNNVASAPNQLVNFADLIPHIKSNTNTFTYPFEGAADGSFADATEDTTKSQIEYKIEMKDVTLSYLAGFSRISRTLINNIPFVENWLPGVLRRDFLKAENTKFMTATASTVTASSEVITGQNMIEMLVNDSANLMALSYMPDWIIVNPADYATILVNSSTEGVYSLPGVVTMSNGFLMLNGLRIVPANWITKNKYLIMDSK
jgi:HK97 family phage major capsid protein